MYVFPYQYECAGLPLYAGHVGLEAVYPLLDGAGRCVDGC